MIKKRKLGLKWMLLTSSWLTSEFSQDDISSPIAAHILDFCDDGSGGDLFAAVNAAASDMFTASSEDASSSSVTTPPAPCSHGDNVSSGATAAAARDAGGVGVEADGPVVAADGEGGGAEELVGAHALVQAVPEDVEHVRAPHRLDGARGPRRRRLRRRCRHVTGQERERSCDFVVRDGVMEWRLKVLVLLLFDDDEAGR